jgi:hypothetical protein
MRDLHTIEDSVLIDMLAEYTVRFTTLFKDYVHLQNVPPDYIACREMLQRITLEVDRRNQLKDAGLTKIAPPKKKI